MYFNSLSSGRITTASFRNLSPLYQIAIQILIHLRELQKHTTVPLIWSSYFKNPDTSADEDSSPHFQKLWCQYLPVGILIL